MQPRQQPIKGVTIDEEFFDHCIKSIGGYRLTDRHVPPHGFQHVDYIVNGFALELKIIEEDPLEKAQHQRAVADLLKEEFPKGPLWVTATTQTARLVGGVSKRWHGILGTPIRKAVKKAASQIRDTRRFLDSHLRGAALLVNAGGVSIDARSFLNLASDYSLRHPEIEGVYGFCAIPNPSDAAQPMVTFSVHSLHLSEDDDGHTSSLGSALDNAVKSRIDALTGRVSRVETVDLKAATPIPVYTLGPSGFQRKK
jgi:hypothetical protein